MPTNLEKYQDAYLAAHVEAHELAEQVMEILVALPSPQEDRPNWAHVGDLQRIIGLLREIVDFAGN